MKKLFLLPVYFYKIFLSPLLGPKCRYTPSCSSYFVQAVEKHGIRPGTYLGIKRFCKCHPFAKTHWETTGGYDPVPDNNNKDQSLT